MSVATERAPVKFGGTRRSEEFEHDLIHDLGLRLGCVWGYEQCIANAAGRPELQEFWRGVIAQEERTIGQLKHLLGRAQSSASISA